MVTDNSEDKGDYENAGPVDRSIQRQLMRGRESVNDEDNDE